MSEILSGDPIADPFKATPEKIKLKIGTGSTGFSGAPTKTTDPPFLTRERYL